MVGRLLACPRARCVLLSVSVPLRGVRERVSKSLPLRMPVRRKPGRPHSDLPGVDWFEPRSKWRGIVRDRSVRVGKAAKRINVGLFDDEQACADEIGRAHV